MSDLQNIKRLILPALRGLHWIVGLCLLCAFLAYQSLKYVTPQYESVAKIKLDHGNEGLSSANLFKDFDVFHYGYKIKAEEELIRSKILINKALDKVDFDISYYRIGDIRTSELYHDAPFRVEIQQPNPITQTQSFTIHLLDSQSFELQLAHESVQGAFNQEVHIGSYVLVIHKNQTLFQQKELSHLLSAYSFTLHSRAGLINMLSEGLDVKALDKDIPILRVSFKGPSSEKVSNFLNALLDAYIEDYIESRRGAAQKTLEFLDGRLHQVKQDLTQSELAIERYRLKHNIINTRQETETDLRKIAQLKIQLSNLEMNAAALDSIHRYIQQEGVNFLELAPNFEAFNDLLSTELIKKVKLLQSEKKDLLMKYTPNNELIKNVDRKIKDIADYLKESIQNSRNSIQIKKEQIAQAIKDANKVFEGLPTKEKQMLVLERDFLFHQKTYNFLSEKRMESAIAQAAQIAFHRIIQRASKPIAPVFPKRKFLIIVAGFIGFMAGLALVYIREFLGGTVSNRQELEKISKTPICGVIKQGKRMASNQDDFDMVATNLQLLYGIQAHQIITMTSTVQQEGKTYLIHQLAKAFARMGQKVLIVDMNLRNPQLHLLTNASNHKGISEAILEQTNLDEVIQQTGHANLSLISAGKMNASPLAIINHSRFQSFLTDLKSNFDLVMVDTPSTAISLDAIALMKLADHTIYAVRAGFTKQLYLLNSDMIREEYGIDNIKLLLNGAHRASNYNGNYTGSRYTYKLKEKGAIGKIKHYAETYLTWK
ncbi:MAG: GumC family protein [Flammeovirgaceae bacterium]